MGNSNLFSQLFRLRRFIFQNTQQSARSERFALSFFLVCGACPFFNEAVAVHIGRRSDYRVLSEFFTRAMPGPLSDQLWRNVEAMTE